MDREGAARLALVASIVGGVSYVASWDLGLPHVWAMAWKGTGVGFLALYAGLRARTTDGWLLAAVMALGTLGDVLLNSANMVPGGVAFLLAHLTAIGLYSRNLRPRPGAPAYACAMGLVGVTAAIAYVLPSDRAGALGVAIYAAACALMAAFAWLSRFPRAWVGLGGLMFVVSDLLIFARMGPLAGQGWVGFGVWSLYYGGQLLIGLGVARALASDKIRLARTALHGERRRAG